MFCQEEDQLHWNGLHTVYTCADNARVVIQKKMFMIDRKYMIE